MQTFRHYYLSHHLFRKSGHDTYLAYPIEAPQHKVVLKVFDAACLAPAIHLNDFRQMETRLQALKHPHIVAVLELGIEQGKPYIVTIYQPGGSLRQYLQQRTSAHLTLEEAVGVVMQVGRAVAFAHTQGMVHQDIRPENILLNKQGKALLADFNLSSILQEQEYKSSSDRRRMNYQAPERMIGVANAASDQYALGCLLYELMSGIIPDPPVLRQQATLTELVAPTTLPSLPRRVEAVLLRTLAIRQNNRYPDVTTFLAALKSAAQPEPPASAFAQFTAGYQQTASGDPTEEEFPPLLPTAPFIAQTAFPQEKGGRLTGLTATSLEAFLTTPEWDGVSLVDRLAIVDGQENALLLSGIPTEVSSKEPPLTSEAQDNTENETVSRAKMALANLSGEGTSIQSQDKDTFVSQEGLPITKKGTEDNSRLDEVSEKSVITTPPLNDGERTTSTAQAQPATAMLQRRRDRDPMRAPRPLISDWKQPIVWLEIALLLTFISALLVYSFNTRVIMVVKTRPLPVSVTNTPSRQPTHIPSSSVHPTPPVTTPTLIPPSNPVVVPIGKTIWLRAVINSSYVSARIDHTDAPLEAMSHSVKTWEEFDIVDAGNGYITLRSRADGDYVCAQFNETNGPLKASSGVLQSCTEFRWINEGNGKIALQVAAGTSYVSARIDLSNAALCAQDTNVPEEILFLWGVVSQSDSSS
ncbi:MAG: serine/threonine protein kinase [Ktedonobacteraceae bacterium]|nr:serine/threonine protein kinase [Ktedonobacteraceae bacterium]